jgi:hemoglobin
MERELFEQLGGREGCERLAATFYAHVGRDPILRRVYGPSVHCAVRSLAAFLVQFAGGPGDYSPSRWSLSLREAHFRFRIDPAAREAWLRCMFAALDEVGIDPRALPALREFLVSASAWIVNRDEAGRFLEAPQALLPGEAPLPAGTADADIAARTEQFFCVEHLANAARAGDRMRLLLLVDSPAAQAAFRADRAAWLSVLALCFEAGGVFLDFVRERLEADPALACDRYTFGRSLLHGAAGAGNAAAVELLLASGADSNAAGRFGETPLHDAADRVGTESAADVVAVLARAGAVADARGGVHRCTALHLAARRGHGAAARALLAAGASREARDRRGDTPLRRAVNCGKYEVAELLLAHGADPDAPGSQGKTPRQAARSAAMRALFGPA